MNKKLYQELFENLTEPKTLKQYEGKLIMLNDFLNSLISKPDYFQHNPFVAVNLKMFQQVQILSHTWEKIIYEFNKVEKSEQEKILELKNEVGLKYFLIYQTQLSATIPEEKLKVVRNVYPLIHYKSSFFNCIKFEELYLLEKIHEKKSRDHNDSIPLT